MPAPNLFQKQQARQPFTERLSDTLKQSGRSFSPSALAVEFNARFAGPAVHMSSCGKWLMGEVIPTQKEAGAAGQHARCDGRLAALW